MQTSGNVNVNLMQDTEVMNDNFLFKETFSDT